jgi:hypothetical protein
MPPGSGDGADIVQAGCGGMIGLDSILSTRNAAGDGVNALIAPI